ncbi:MAG: virulence factor family protein, partial [Rhizomicrobium sp.]
AHGFTNYLTPIVAGIGEGATLAEMVLTEAPPATIAGVVSFNPSATIVSRLPICTPAATRARANGFSYGFIRKLRGFWTIGLSPELPKEDRDYVTALRRDSTQLQLREFNSNEAAGDAIRALIEPHLSKPKAAVTNISALPLIILGVGHPSRIMAVVMSGDGGWRDLDKTIAEDLQRAGVPVVGWDSLRYFWSRKTPLQTADDLAAVTETFMARWQASEVALVGYSFGADVMPFAYNRLPDSLRSHVALIALLGFAKEADFEITLSGWLGEPPGPDAVPVLPETNKIPPRLMQCFYGQDEKDTACPELARRGTQVIRITGGHHFNGDYEALASRILTTFERQAGPLPLLASEGQTAMVIPGGWLYKKHRRVLLLVATMIVLLTLLLLWIARRNSHTGCLHRRN